MNDKKAAALDLLREGASISEAARKIGASRQAVSLWNKQAGDIAIKRGRITSGTTSSQIIVSAITERVQRPAPDEIRMLRTKCGLTQEQAAMMLKESGHYQAWCSHEAREDLMRHHKISLAEWELFLLLTGEHPLYRLVPKT